MDIFDHETNISQQQSSSVSQNIEQSTINKEYDPATYSDRLQQTGYGWGYRNCTTQGERIQQIIKQEAELAKLVNPFAIEINKFLKPNTGGNEHDVFIDLGTREVYKRLKNTSVKWGRQEWNPIDYINSIALFNQIVPHVRIDIIGCARLASGDITIVTKMPLAEGVHLSDKATHMALLAQGFVIFQDRSTTLDYLHKESNIIIRDAHNKNFVTNGGELTPIDLQVERN